MMTMMLIMILQFKETASAKKPIRHNINDSFRNEQAPIKNEQAPKSFLNGRRKNCRTFQGRVCSFRPGTLSVHVSLHLYLLEEFFVPGIWYEI